MTWDYTVYMIPAVSPFVFLLLLEGARLKVRTLLSGVAMWI